jgi:hypothetical protein
MKGAAAGDGCSVVSADARAPCALARYCGFSAPRCEADERASIMAGALDRKKHADVT